jgi:cellulose synthase operon protein YhjQ
MIVLSVISMKGGVGKTSITANLASALSRLPNAPLIAVIDLDPQNALQWHFGFNEQQSPGLCSLAVNGGTLRDACVKTDKGTLCYPYGYADEPTRRDFEALLTEDPEWLKQQLVNLNLPKNTIFLIDTPPGQSPYMAQAISSANIALVVLLADGASYATAPTMETAFEEMIPLNPYLKSAYLLNQIDPTNTLANDIQVMLRHRLGERLIPIHISEDEAVREALAFQQSVLVYDENGLAGNDFKSLASWVIGLDFE